MRVFIYNIVVLCILIPLYYYDQFTSRDNFLVVIGIIMAWIADSLHKMDKKG